MRIDSRLRRRTSCLSFNSSFFVKIPCELLWNDSENTPAGSYAGVRKWEWECQYRGLNQSRFLRNGSVPNQQIMSWLGASAFKTLLLYQRNEISRAIKYSKKMSKLYEFIRVSDLFEYTKLYLLYLISSVPTWVFWALAMLRNYMFWTL